MENKSSPRPTLRSIARAAGVSVGTVSLALRDHPQIARETRARLKALATRLGYRPDPQVAKLMSYLQQRKRRQGDGTLAYITAFAQPEVWRESETWTKYFEGARSKAESLGYRLEHFWARSPGVSEQRLSRILHARGIEGLLIAPVPGSHQRLKLEWERFSTVAFGHSLREPRLHRVMHHHLHTVALATAALRARGYQRIGLVIQPDHDECVLNFWSTGLLAFQKTSEPRHVVPVFREAIEPRALLKWFRRHRPDAIISDEFSPVRILATAGYRVPGDCAYVTLDWLERTQPFAGVDQHSRDIGAAAVKQLISAIQHDEHGIPTRPETLMIEGSWVDGDSLPARKGEAAGTAPLQPALLRSTWQ